MSRSHCIVTIFVVSMMFLQGEATLGSDPQDYLVKVGVMEPATDTEDRLRETQRLTMDPTRRPGFCFLVHPPNAEAYEVYSIHHLPDSPSHLTGDFNGVQSTQAPKGIRTATKRVDGIRPFCFDFHPGDPLGEYRIEVFINDALKATLRLDVVSASAPSEEK